MGKYGLDNINKPAFDAAVQEINNNSTVKRFKNVYIDELPEDIREIVDSHFDDTNRKITLTKEDLTNYLFENLSSYIITFSTSTVIGTGKYLTDSNKNISVLHSSSATYLYCVLNISGKSYTIQCNTGNSHKWQLTINGSISGFTSDYELTLNQPYYSIFKEKIYKDLLLNLGYQVIPSMSTLNEIPNVENAPDGSISKALGLDSSGNVVKQLFASGGVKLFYVMTRLNLKYYNAANDEYKNADYTPIYLIIASGGTPTIEYFDSGLKINNGIILNCFYDNSQIFTTDDDVKYNYISYSYSNSGQSTVSFRMRAMAFKSDGTLKTDMLEMITALRGTPTLVQII